MKHYKKKKLQSEIKRLIKKYVKILKLKDWHIDIITTKDDIISSRRGKIKTSKADYYGEVIYNYLTRAATITLTKLQMIEEPQELEDTIFHELIHIKLAPIMQLSESLITLSEVNKDKATQLISQLDEHEHDLIDTIIQLHNKKD